LPRIYNTWLVVFHNFSVVYVLVAPSPVPHTVTLTLRLVTSMPNLATTGSSTLDCLIDEVKLVEHIDVSVKGDAADTEDEIDYPTATNGGAHDHARLEASSFQSSQWRKGF
ncbi:hypothetical protein Ancab_039254, partial [Ancistrocladus abbreviatus]